MKVRLTLDVDAAARFVVAKYFAASAKPGDTKRTRATRKQMAKFALAALRTAVSDQAEQLDLRSRRRAKRLQAGMPAGSLLHPPREQEWELPW